METVVLWIASFSVGFPRTESNFLLLFGRASLSKLLHILKAKNASKQLKTHRNACYTGLYHLDAG